jgi:hypothetical protein
MNVMDKIKKLDKFWIGFTAGLIIPVLSLSIVYIHTFYPSYNIKEFFDFLYTMHITSKLFSLCVLPNLLLFFLFIWGELYKGARGALGATIVTAIAVVIIQFSM